MRDAGEWVSRDLGPAHLGPYDPGGTLFFNVNTPEDSARAIELETKGRSSRFGPESYRSPNG